MKKIKLILIILWLLFHIVMLVTIKYEKVLPYQKRDSYKFSKFNFTSFLSSNYQKNTENALNDQIHNSDNLKKAKAGLDSTVYKNLSTYTIPKDTYNIAVGEFFFYKDSDYLVDWPRTSKWLNNTNEELKQISDGYNNVEGVKKYYYYINTSDSINFDTNKNNLCKTVKNAYNTYKFDSFNINNYDDYTKYFYKSDFHWNNRASYKGYKQIVNLMMGTNEPVLKPMNEITISNEFYGNKARQNQYYYVKDKFRYYNFNYKKNSKYDNGILVNENKDDLQDDCLDNKYYYDLYGSFGKELEYDFYQPNKENLLIISNSFGFPIGKLIASHYNKTYMIDLRENTDFNINEYIRKKDIDNLLVISSGVHYVDSQFKLKGV